MNERKNGMKEILLTLLIGCVAGTIDILPMIKMKLDKYALSSAFAFYFVMPFVIFNIAFFENLWWLKGGLITLVLAIPTTILASKADKKAIIPISIMAIVLGTAIGVAGHFLGIM
jgi:hypothetical protein